MLRKPSITVCVIVLAILGTCCSTTGGLPEGLVTCMTPPPENLDFDADAQDGLKLDLTNIISSTSAAGVDFSAQYKSKAKVAYLPFEKDELALWLMLKAVECQSRYAVDPLPAPMQKELILAAFDAYRQAKGQQGSGGRTIDAILEGDILHSPADGEWMLRKILEALEERPQ